MVFNDSNQWSLVGLTSHGYNYSSVYTRVSAYRAWMDQNILGSNLFNGNRCEGQMKGDKMHGKGMCHFSDRNRYVGDWFRDKRAGHGVYTWSSGKIYTGQFNDSKILGKGVITWPSGDRYEGQCKDGDMHGTGTFHSNGRKFEGHWMDDQFDSGCR